MAKIVLILKKKAPKRIVKVIKMSDYRLEIKNPIPLVLLIPKSISKINGVNKKE